MIFKQSIIHLSSLTIFISLTACGGGSTSTPLPPAVDKSAPKVILTSPASEDISVKLNTDIIITFDKNIKKAKKSNIAISPVTSNQQITFTSETLDNTITITPDTGQIKESVIYQVVISAIKSAVDSTMIKDCVWQFETTGPNQTALIRTGNTGACASPWLYTKQFGVASTSTRSRGITTDSSGNILVTGTTAGNLHNNTLTGFSDLFISKFDTNGTRLSTKLLGASLSATGGADIVVDSSGNVLVTGSTSGAIANNTKTGFTDFFLSKFSPDGTVSTQQFGAASANTTATAITVDKFGNTLVTGYTDGGLDGNNKVGNTDYFITKFKLDGTRWTKQIGIATATAYARDITTDANGNIVVIGYTDGNLSAGSKVGIQDLFISKLSIDGNLIWTNQVGSAQRVAIGNDVVIDRAGNILITGYATAGIFGSTQIGTGDCLVIKINPNDGSLIWSRQFGVVSKFTIGTGISTDKSDNIYVTGSTQGALPGNTLTGIEDYFVIKISSSGSKQWMHQRGATATNIDYTKITTDSAGQIFVTGSTTAALDGNKLIGSADYFISKFNSNSANK